MATLALSKDFLTSLGQLPKQIQASVNKSVELFRQLDAMQLRAHKGLHLEPYTGSKDDRARTIRITDNFRGIVLDLGDNEHFILVDIATHDDVDHWMMHNIFRVNEATGALEIIDTIRLDAAIADQPNPSEALGDQLFAHRRDRDFVNLGIHESLIPVLRAMTTQTELYGLIGVLPENQAEVVLALSDANTVDEIYADLAGGIDPATIDSSNPVAALETPASRARFAVVASDDHLQSVLAKPLAQWRLYLHPTQRGVAYRKSYSGPSRVTGGAGTGKTVVAIHRAVHLARQVDASLGRPVLFTTFTKNLAQEIERDIRDLAGAEVAGRIEVINVDALAHRVVRDAEDRRPQLATQKHVTDLFERVIDERGLDFTASFIVNEWEHVVLARRCSTRGEYFNVSRTGRGIPLDRRKRAAVWGAIEEVTRQMTEQGQRTFLQLADAAAGYLDARSVKPYEHVVVDEAQDLHEAQWRMLRAAVVRQADDMFLVGDSHQRIYNHRSSLRQVGIDVVGRSKKLKINYRTTHEILGFALGILGDVEYDDLDEGRDQHDLAGYHSYSHGPPPILSGQRSSKAQHDALVDQIRSWTEQDLAFDEIAVGGRTAKSVEAARAALTAAGIPTCVLDGSVPTSDGVRLATMHRLKGVEFRCVAVVDADDDTLPARGALTSERQDAVQHQNDLQRERCLLYVACTRARDGLWVGWSGKPSRFLPGDAT